MRALGGCVPTVQNTVFVGFRQEPAISANFSTSVEIVIMRPTPAARARATTRVAIGGEIGKIEMAMAVDQHGLARRVGPA